MTVIDSKPSSEFPSSKGKERNVLVLTALICCTSACTSEVPDFKNKGDLSQPHRRGVRNNEFSDRCKGSMFTPQNRLCVEEAE